jgi:glutaredoxin
VPEPARTIEPMSRVRLLSKPGCHLCEDARAVVAEVCAESGETFDEVDISSDAELTRRYWDQIPVTFVDGRQHDFWRVDAGRLRTALQRPPVGS